MKGLDAQQNYIPELVQPLFDNTDIDFFEYQKMLPNSSGIYLSSQPLLSDICIEKNLQSPYHRLKAVYEQKKVINSLHNIFYFLPKEDNQPVNVVVKDFGYENIFCIIEYFADYIQSFVFASHRSEDLIRFCFTNFDVLIQFKQYFLRQARKLITEAEKHRIQLVEDDETNAARHGELKAKARSPR